MKVGDYVRTKKNKIYKIIDKKFDETILVVLYQTDISGYLMEMDIKKSSPNIIDLIEEGDYVNGWKVIEHAHEPGRLFVPYVYIGGKGFTTYEDYSWELKKENEDNIHTIVTKEQFEEMEYKIND